MNWREASLARAKDGHLMMDQPIFWSGPLLAGALTWLMLRLMAPVATRLSLLDHPKGRKDHSHPTPITGGIAMALAVAWEWSGVLTVTVKWGLLDDGLDDLDGETYSRAKLSAVHLSPQRARHLIRDGALQAMIQLKETPQSFCYPNLHPPYIRAAHFRHDGTTPQSTARDEHPSSIIALMNLPYTKVV